ncbi:MEDS domain-containing protein [Flavobacterium selenitireducens]|uniref:MEDS domain-containing protein n=1 Tax=Flavobacterium selenitireducens TaxID=2722704 RepID=UPI00168BBF3D|nr:MEDS domain-containing protein [Flavobacterium selenitireducens]MBD3583065.1 hypothetical protein [Flavobacterium selenitireducens]
MPSKSTYSGITVLGDVKWGSHFSTFYQSEEELLKIMISYFTAGLRNNEYCVWIFAEPLTLHTAMKAFADSFPHTEMYLGKEQLNVMKYDEFYFTNGQFDAEDVLAKFALLYEIAIAKGFTGVRVNGIESWVGEDIWPDFMEYEKKLDTLVSDKNVIVHCSYPLRQNDTAAMIDVLQVHGTAITSQAGQLLILDNKETRKTKAQLVETNEKLEALVRERTKNLEQIIVQMETEAAARLLAEKKLVKIARDLEKRNADLQQFGYIVSHNLRGPITNISCIAMLLDEMPDERVSLQKGMLDAIGQLEAIIVDLNLILRVKFELSEAKEEISFSNLADALRSGMAQQLERTGAVIRTDFTEVDRLVTTRAYLYSIFLNLVDNSIKYRSSERTPVIDIRSELRPHLVKIIFTDNGIGIDMQLHSERVFGLYQRFMTGIDGRGMGLFMVRAQAESLGGTISLTSVPGEGSRFVLELPVVENTC